MPIKYTQEGATPVSNLKRLTTEYVDVEDRMRLTGELDGGETVVLWLTLRLLNRLLPHLLDLLQKQTAAAVGSTVESVQTQMVQTFSQQSARARAQETPQQPVRQTEASSTWLVVSVDVTSSKPGDPGGLISRLTFRGAEECVSIPLPATQLRQWMSILHDQSRMAGWIIDTLPPWIAQEMTTDNVTGSFH